MNNLQVHNPYFKQMTCHQSKILTLTIVIQSREINIKYERNFVLFRLTVEIRFPKCNNDDCV